MNEAMVKAVKAAARLVRSVALRWMVALAGGEKNVDMIWIVELNRRCETLCNSKSTATQFISTW
jgi:hypothetical protein